MGNTYATLNLIPIENSVDIHTLLKQMGNSAEMIDLHRSKLISKLTAERLAK